MGSDSEFAKIVNDNFRNFDDNRNGLISRDDLEKAQANEKLSEEAREAAHALLVNFDQATKMAGGAVPDSLEQASFGWRQYRKIFDDPWGDAGGDRAITGDDVDVMQLATADPSELDELLNKNRQVQVEQGRGSMLGGAALLLPGLALDVVGIATFGTPGTAALIPGAIGTVAGSTMIYSGYRELTQPTNELIRDRLSDNQQKIQSWLTE